MTPYYRRFTTFLRAAFYVLYGFEVVGREKVPTEGRLIFVSNHISWMDPLVLGAALKTRQIFFMAKKELFERPYVGSIIGSLAAFPVDRGGSDRKALRRALEHLGHEEALGIYPEGTRTESGPMREWQAGVALLASKTRSPIVPVAVFETREIFEGRRGWPTGRPLRIIFGDPIATEGDQEQILSKAKAAVEALLEQHKRS